MEFAERLKTTRLKTGLTQREIAQQLNTTYQNYQKWENGTRNLPKKINIEKIAEILDTTPEYLTNTEVLPNYQKLTEENQKKVIDYTKELLKQQKDSIISISEKLYEYNIEEKLSAGHGYGYSEDKNYSIEYYNEWIDHDRATYIFGDSMEPDYHNGDVALIKVNQYIDNGLVYAIDWDGQSYIKKVYKEKDDLRLVSLNPKYKDKFASSEEEPRIIGKVIATFTPIKNY